MKNFMFAVLFSMFPIFAFATCSVVAGTSATVNQAVLNSLSSILWGINPSDGLLHIVSLNSDCTIGGSGGGGGGGGAVTAAAGSYASGALVDGSIVTLGTQSDTAWSLSGNSTSNAALKKIALELQTVAVTGTFYQTTQPISAAALPLPSGAATAANQTSSLSNVGTSATIAQTIQGSATGVAVPVAGAFYQATQPISAFSLPLPTGAATAALQPALNGDGGAAAHVTNFPSSQPVTLTTNAGTVTQVSHTCATTNGQVQASGVASVFEIVQNSGATPIWLLFSSGTATTAPPSFEILAGQTVTFSNGPDNYLPTGSWFCIATTADVFSVMYK
jgi:hypothetical protein